MEIIKATENNLASIIMGKNISFPWRGQSDLLISVPFDEWLKFINKYHVIIGNRKPLDYSKMLQASEEVKVRYFFYEMSWALYAELANSSNINKDATIILPYFEGGKSIDILDALIEVNKMDSALVDKYHNSLKASTRNYYNLTGDADLSYGLVNTGNLSDWNTLVFKICIYLQSKSSNKVVTEKLNIDWRIS